jgi:diguanylate cyclase (GGDEF)-like protein/PAS domain S-box-containing protein
MTRRKPPGALIVVLLIALATAVATLMAAAHDRHAVAAQQRLLAERAVGALGDSVSSTTSRLTDVAGLFVADPGAGQQEFTAIGRRLLDDPALVSVLFVARVPAAGRSAFERGSRLGIADVVAGTRRRAPQRPLYYPVKYLAGGIGATRARALDLGADPVRGAVVRAAIDSAQAHTSQPLSLPGDGARGVLVATPVYRHGVAPATVAERRVAALGLAVAAVRTDRLIGALAAHLPSGTTFSVREDGHPVGRSGGVPHASLAQSFSAAGERWQIFVGRPGTGPGMARTVLAAGSLLTLAIGLLIFQAARRERYALALVDERMRERDRAMEDLRAEIGERVRAEVALRESVERLETAEERFRTAFEAAPIGMALADLDARFLQVNDALCRITGHPREALAAMRLDDVTHPQDVARGRELMRDLIGGRKGAYKIEQRYVHALGHVVWVSLHATLVRAADGTPQHFLIQIQDVSERVRYEAQLQHMADHDPLTGLLNRRSFERELNHHIAQVQRYGPQGAAIVLDIDRFKHINDTLGHNVGDELIVKVAHTLRSRLRDSDVLARLGGDEFAVLMPRGQKEEALSVAESILHAVREQVVVTGAGRRRRVTASVGLALFRDVERLSAEDVLVNADLAMYDAKEGGRDRAAMFTSGERDASRMKARITWGERIRDALEEDRFTLYAQPIVELSSGEVRQHELLLRMVDEDGEIVPPAAFLSTAERFDLVQEIDRWVVARAIRLMAEQRRVGRDLVFEVNISGSSTGDPELLRIIERELEIGEVNPANLVLEVTETTAVANIPRAQRFASHLAKLGCRFALDDFGAGFGSFYYLKHLPFDILKIDGEFVRTCATSETDQLLIRAAVDIARGMGKETIAEYVGDQRTVELLRELGVDYAQGFHVGHPGPIEERLMLDLIKPLTADNL